MKAPYETFEQIQTHYELEKRLASKLKNSSREERKTLYSSLYDQMFQEIPFHPQITRKKDINDSKREVDRKMRLVSRFLKPETSFAEIGPGDCNFSIDACSKVKTVKALDVSSEITQRNDLPENFELVLFDGCSIPLEDKNVDLVYSNQLMEHLHPEDANSQLQEIQRILKVGGKYVCITPNRLSGPHDVSQYFDSVATGFHLKEYTYTDLRAAFLEAGFSRVQTYIGGKGIYLRFPVFAVEAIEAFLDAAPSTLRKLLGRSLPGRFLLGAIVVGEK